MISQSKVTHQYDTQVNEVHSICTCILTWSQITFSLLLVTGELLLSTSVRTWFLCAIDCQSCITQSLVIKSTGYRFLVLCNRAADRYKTKLYTFLTENWQPLSFSDSDAYHHDEVEPGREPQTPCCDLKSCHTQISLKQTKPLSVRCEKYRHAFWRHGEAERGTKRSADRYRRSLEPSTPIGLLHTFDV